MAWQGATKSTLHGETLWSEAVTERDFKGFRVEQGVLEEIVYFWKSVGLEVDKEDIKELATAQFEELIMEKLAELQMQQHMWFLQEIAEETEANEIISSSEIKEV